MTALVLAIATTVGAHPAQPAAMGAVMRTLEAPRALSLARSSGPLMFVHRSGGNAAHAEDVCFGDYCPPRVSIDGYEPRYDADARKLELAFRVLRSIGWAPLTRVAEICQTTGLTIDVRPGVVDSMSGRPAHGWGEARLFLRWRLDALGRPTWAQGN